MVGIPLGFFWAQGTGLRVFTLTLNGDRRQGGTVIQNRSTVLLKAGFAIYLSISLKQIT